jgi:hypothetical protein
MYVVETDRPDPVPIEDLKIVVSSSVPVWITWDQRRASTCLRRLEALGHVRVSQGERSREEKPPQRPRAQHVRLSRPQRQVPPTPPAPTPAASPEQTFTKADLDAAVAEAAAKASQQTAAMLMEQMKALMPQAAPAPAPASVDAETIQVAVEKALENKALVAPSGSVAAHKSPSRAPDEPLFIPTGIVGNDDTELTIEAESTEDAGLADAAAQLKKLRKRKKKES